jgi:hypothetical protein
MWHAATCLNKADREPTTGLTTAGHNIKDTLHHLNHHSLLLLEHLAPSRCRSAQPYTQLLSIRQPRLQLWCQAHPSVQATPAPVAQYTQH